MALPADEGDRAHLRRRGAVVAMAIVADGRRKVFFLEKRPGVNALLIILDLSDGDPVAFHEISVGMAAAAGLRDVPGKSLGLGEIGRHNAMNAMAVCADGRFGIALLEPLAVLAGPINDKRVHTDIGIKLPHVGGVGMAGATELRNLGPGWGVLEGTILCQPA